MMSLCVLLIYSSLTGRAAFRYNNAARKGKALPNGRRSCSSFPRGATSAPLSTYERGDAHADHDDGAVPALHDPHWRRFPDYPGKQKEVTAVSASPSSAITSSLVRS